MAIQCLPPGPTINFMSLTIIPDGSTADRYPTTVPAAFGRGCHRRIIGAPHDGVAPRLALGAND
jgi:hypothetical protein